MTSFKASTAYVSEHPVRTGIVVVLAVLATGALSALALGYDAPTRAAAQVVPTVTPVVVTAPVVTPVAPAVVPIIPVVIVPTIPTPVTVVSGVTVTAPTTSTDTSTTPTDTSSPSVTTTSPFGPPCCTLTTTDTVTTPVVVTTPPVILPPVITPPITATPPPVDVCPNIDGLQSDIPSGMTKDGSGNCVPPSGNPPSCTLTASASSVLPGTPVTLTWTTQNAASGSIDHGVGNATPITTGSRATVVSANTTYTMTTIGTNGQRVTCAAPVTVTTTNPNTPACTLTASASSVVRGSTVTLSWTSQHLISGTINQGVGNATPIASGSRTVTVTDNTTYTLTGLGTNGQTVSCAAPVTVTTTGGSGPTCTLAASASSVARGGNVTFAWTTTNAASGAIDNGVGSTTPIAGGTTAPVTVNANTTYTLTVLGTNGQTVTCAAPVTVTSTGGGGPACTLSASPTTVTNGNQTTLTWGGTDIASVFIDNDIGTTTGPSGSQSVTVNGVGVHTYTGTFKATNGSTLTCTATVTVESGGGGCVSGCGGGGSSGPRVLLSSLRNPGDQPLSFVYLSQIPYTGLELGPWGTALYWIMLILWSLAAAYLVFFTAMPFAFARVSSFGGKVKEALNSGVALSTHAPAHGDSHHAHAAPVARGHAPAHTSSGAHGHDDHGHHAPVEPPKPTLAADGFRAFTSGGALSIDDIVKGLAREAEAHPEASAHDLPVDFAHAHAPAPVMHVAEAPVAHVSEAPVYAATPAPVAAPISHDVREFLAALIAGNRDAVFGTVRAITRQGGDSEEFLTHAVCALDDAYRAQVDGSVCHPDIAALTANCHPSFLERLVTSLTTAVDGSYSTGVTGVKLALTRALAVVNG